MDIYRVRGDYLSIQIIETKRLPADENLWLKSLTNDLESGAARVILEAGKGRASAFTFQSLRNYRNLKNF
jgi:hypothetical protein